MTERSSTDGRRELGAQTRQRLLEATRGLLAERGEDAVTLRDITEAAHANVAAVSYHFGSLAALRRATIEQALDALVDGQIAEFRALGDDATVEQIAAAFAQPLIASFGSPGCAEVPLLRIMARVASNPPPEMEEWITATLGRSDAELFPRLHRALPGLSDDELHFRVEAVVGIMQYLIVGGMRMDLHQKSPDELTRWLLPVITGGLTAPPMKKPRKKGG